MPCGVEGMWAAGVRVEVREGDSTPCGVEGMRAGGVQL